MNEADGTEKLLYYSTSPTCIDISTVKTYTGASDLQTEALSFLAWLTFWDGWFSALRGCPVLCRVASSITDFYPLDANTTSPVAASTKNTSRHFQTPQESIYFHLSTKDPSFRNFSIFPLLPNDSANPPDVYVLRSAPQGCQSSKKCPVAGSPATMQW